MRFENTALNSEFDVLGLRSDVLGLESVQQTTEQFWFGIFNKKDQTMGFLFLDNLIRQFNERNLGIV